MMERQRRVDRPDGSVQSLTRALAILEVLADGADGRGLSALARSLDLPPSTAHRLLTTMERQRFVRFEPLSKTWRIGVRAFTVGSAFARTRDLLTIARPHMRRLMEASGETVTFFTLADGEALCTAQVECRQATPSIPRPGGSSSMHATGAGKAMLAYLPEREVERVLSRHGLARATANTFVSATGLKAELRRIRTRGFAVDDEEFAIGLRCVAAPILDEHGAPFAALSLSGPTVRVSNRRIDTLGHLVLGAARATMADLGGCIAAP